MLLIGSQALVANGFKLNRKPKDFDYICTFGEFKQWRLENAELLHFCYPIKDNKWIAKVGQCAGDPNGRMYEFEIAWPDSVAYMLLLHHSSDWFGPSAGLASLSECLALKLSHRFLKNSPAFLKTMEDIWVLRLAEVGLNPWLENWVKLRETETYNYAHPSLAQDKKSFFTDNVNYIYEHDDIHKAVAIGHVPAYTLYSVEGEEVQCSREKFEALPFETKINGVTEEAYVLALERSLIPYPSAKTGKQAFDYALMKVCTSITSGWFREFAWENYYAVQGNFSPWFSLNFSIAAKTGKVRKVVK